MLVRRTSVTALAVLVAAGCSNAQAPTNKQSHAGTATASAGVGGIQTITVTSGVDLRFTPSTLVVHPGRVRIVLSNTSKPGAGPPHDLTFTGLPGVYVGTTQPGRQQSVSFEAPAPGTYRFVCTIHAAQNQSGKLVVRP
jgi:plastocyanin